METLINEITQKTGLSEEKARTAIEIVIGYLKEKLPAPIASQIDSAISGKGIAGKLGDVTEGVGGMFGKK